MPEELELLIDRAAQVLKDAGAQEVYLFGSLATGKYAENSDIDLAVSGLPPELFFKTMSRIGDIVKLPFDLVDLDEETPFTSYLKKRGKLIRVG